MGQGRQPVGSARGHYDRSQSSPDQRARGHLSAEHCKSVHMAHITRDEIAHQYKSTSSTVGQCQSMGEDDR